MMNGKTAHRRMRSIWLALFVSCLMLCVPHLFGQSTKQGSPVTTVKTPEWFTTVPIDSGHVTARGQGRSRDRQVAYDKAVAEARRRIADMVMRRRKALLLAIETESGSLREKRAEPVTLTGSTPTKQSLIRRGRMWTAYVLMSVTEKSIHESILSWLHNDAGWYGEVKGTKALQEFETR
jgi:hypothetical protein